MSDSSDDSLSGCRPKKKDNSLSGHPTKPRALPGVRKPVISGSLSGSDSDSDSLTDTPVPKPPARRKVGSTNVPASDSDSDSLSEYQTKPKALPEFRKLVISGSSDSDRRKVLPAQPDAPQPPPGPRPAFTEVVKAAISPLEAHLIARQRRMPFTLGRVRDDRTDSSDRPFGLMDDETALVQSRAGISDALRRVAGTMAGLDGADRFDGCTCLCLCRTMIVGSGDFTVEVLRDEGDGALRACDLKLLVDPPASKAKEMEPRPVLVATALGVYWGYDVLGAFPAFRSAASSAATVAGSRVTSLRLGEPTGVLTSERGRTCILRALAKHDQLCFTVAVVLPAGR